MLESGLLLLMGMGEDITVMWWSSELLAGQASPSVASTCAPDVEEELDAKATYFHLN